nr:17-hydroxy-3-oxo-4-pregnene-20-carboxyl-CoA lyase-like [Nerophis lumbriciformis]
MKLQRVAIIGAAAAPVSRYGRPYGARPAISEADLLSQIAAEALNESSVNPRDVGSAVFTMVSPNTLQQGFASHMSSRLGLRCSGQISQVMEMGITGGLAFDQAAADIALGRADFSLALGAAFTSSGNPDNAMEMGLRVVGDAEFQAPFGVTPIAWYAMDAQRYMYETGATREQLAAVAVKSRRAAMSNPLAQFRDPLSLSQVLSARWIVEPLGLFDVPAMADGAICLVLASEDAARESGQPFVTVNGRGFYHDGRHQIGAEPSDITAFESLRRAGPAALTEAGISLADIDLTEIYAPCTITEVLATEALGWFERGVGAFAAERGETAIDGAIPVNPSGGCLSRGHPPALTGLYGMLELREQLLGKSKNRQVPKATLGLNTCEAGNYNAALVHVLEGPQ